MAKFFEIDAKNKTFIFSHKKFQDLFVEGTEVNEAFRAAMALGCYEGFTPVERPRKSKQKPKKERNTATQAFTEKGVIEWLQIHDKDWLDTWEALSYLKKADGDKYPFMVRKNYFLFYHEEARAYVGMDPKAEYVLTALGKALEMDVKALDIPAFLEEKRATKSE